MSFNLAVFTVVLGSFSTGVSVSTIAFVLTGGGC